MYHNREPIALLLRFDAELLFTVDGVVLFKFQFKLIS